MIGSQQLKGISSGELAAEDETGSKDYWLKILGSLALAFLIDSTQSLCAATLISVV